MRKLIIAALAAAALPGIAQAAAFTNGGFETSSVSPTPFANVDANANPGAIDGWTVTAGNIDYIGDYWAAAEGARSLDLSGGGAGAIAQTFDTIANGVYLVNFWLAGNPVGGPQVKTLTVSAGAFSSDYMFDTAGASTSAMNWALQSFTFAATSGATTLSFASTTPGAYGPALDGVTVTYLSPVPEPATWAMLIAGLGAIGGTLRRRARHAAFA